MFAFAEEFNIIMVIIDPKLCQFDPVGSLQFSWSTN